jgi:hypothetical protein
VIHDIAFRDMKSYEQQKHENSTRGPVKVCPFKGSRTVDRIDGYVFLPAMDCKALHSLILP